MPNLHALDGKARTAFGSQVGKPNDHHKRRPEKPKHNGSLGHDTQGIQRTYGVTLLKEHAGGVRYSRNKSGLRGLLGLPVLMMVAAVSALAEREGYVSYRGRGVYRLHGQEDTGHRTRHTRNLQDGTTLTVLSSSIGLCVHSQF